VKRTCVVGGVTWERDGDGDDWRVPARGWKLSVHRERAHWRAVVWLGKWACVRRAGSRRRAMALAWNFAKDRT